MTVRFRVWRTNMASMLLLLLLLLLKYYPEEKNIECEKKLKMFQIDLDSDLKEKPDLKSRCCFILFGSVMQES